MKQFKVQITTKAYMDMNDICTYIAENLCSPITASKQLKRFMVAINGLSIMPGRIKVIETERDMPFELRRLLVDNYSILFFIDGNTVKVLRIIYSSSKNLDLL